MPEGTRVTFKMVENRFPIVIRAVNARADAVEAKVKRQIAESARSRVAVLTGETRDSIEVTPDGVEVGGAALFLEHGTRKMSAQPFLGPAVEEAKATIGVEYSFLFVGLGGLPL